MQSAGEHFRTPESMLCVLTTNACDNAIVQMTPRGKCEEEIVERLNEIKGR